MKLLKFTVASILASGTLFAGTFNVDKSHSSVGFKVKHMMVSNVKGNFNDFSGSFEYDKENNTITSLNGKVIVDSINTGNVKRDGHLKADDFFAANKYPTITFDLDKIKGNKAIGTLTMRGVSKKVEFDIELAGTTIKDPWGNTRTGFVLTGEVDRFDYGLKYNSVIEAGGLAVGRDVKFEVEIEGIEKK